MKEAKVHQTSAQWKPCAGTLLCYSNHLLENKAPIEHLFLSFVFNHPQHPISRSVSATKCIRLGLHSFPGRTIFQGFSQLRNKNRIPRLSWEPPRICALGRSFPCALQRAYFLKVCCNGVHGGQMLNVALKTLRTFARAWNRCHLMEEEKPPVSWKAPFSTSGGTDVRPLPSLRQWTASLIISSLAFFSHVGDKRGQCVPTDTGLISTYVVFTSLIWESVASYILKLFQVGSKHLGSVRAQHASWCCRFQKI